MGRVVRISHGLAQLRSHSVSASAKAHYHSASSYCCREVFHIVSALPESFSYELLSEFHLSEYISHLFKFGRIVSYGLLKQYFHVSENCDLSSGGTRVYHQDVCMFHIKSSP